MVRHDMYEAISPSHALAHAAEGLSVLVTGSGRGVGRAEALAFAQAGAKKIVLTSRSRNELQDAQDEIERALRESGRECEVVVHEADVCDPASVDALFEAAGELDGESSRVYACTHPSRPPASRTERAALRVLTPELLTVVAAIDACSADQQRRVP